jgi:hypothetical protein
MTIEVPQKLIEAMKQYADDRADEIDLAIELFRIAAIHHGMETANYTVLGCGYNPENTEKKMQEREHNLRELLYNKSNGE